jgi:hypothetical protein
MLAEAEMGVAGLALRSSANFVHLVATSSLHLGRDKLGRQYFANDGGTYKVFRESYVPLEYTVGRTVLEVGFRLKLIRSSRWLHWSFQRLCILTTPFWCGFSGFGIKLWLVDPKTKNYMGLYQWDGGAAARAYASALMRVLRPLSTPNSVWFKVYDNQDLGDFLSHRNAIEASTVPNLNHS